MANDIRLLDVVALAVDKPERGLQRGQVGTVVELLGEGVCEIEFADQSGNAYAFAALHTSELIALRYEPAQATG